MIAATVRRITRPQRHRDDNESHARQYGKVLRGHLRSLADEPSPTASLHHYVEQMHDVARATYPAAFLRGKQQAIGSLARVSLYNQLWIDRKLAWNHAYLRESLMPDVLAKAERQRLHMVRNPEERRSVLDRSFGSRLEDMYGGTLWTVTEAGFRAGIESLVSHRVYPVQIGQESSPSILAQPTEAEIAYPQLPIHGEPTKAQWVSIVAGLLNKTAAEVVDDYYKLDMGLAYVTEHDDGVCPPCEDIQGDYFAPDRAPLPGELCVPGETLVTSPHLLESHRRRYRGPMVRIRTVGGRNLSCTPNHPVLTRRGWVEADKLREGEDLVCGSLGEGVSSGDPDVHHIPTRIDEIHRSRLNPLFVDGEAFVSMHLDVDVPDGQVEVIGADGVLATYSDAETSKHGGQLVFADAHMCLLPFLGLGHFGQGGGGWRFSPYGIMGGAGLGLSFVGGQARANQGGAFGGASHNTHSVQALRHDHSVHAEGLSDGLGRFASQVPGTKLIDGSGPQASTGIEWPRTIGFSYAPNGDIGLDQSGSDGGAGYTEFLRQAQLGYATDISLDKIAQVSIEFFDGHVYNLSTDMRWYVANGAIVHNCEGYSRCRCQLEMVVRTRQ